MRSVTFSVTQPSALLARGVCGVSGGGGGVNGGPV